MRMREVSRSRPPNGRARVWKRRRLCAGVLAAALGMLAPRYALAQPSAPSEVEQVDAEAGRLFGEGRLAEALPLAERSLALHERAHGPNHATVMAAARNLGMLRSMLGDVAGALPLYERVVSIASRLYGANSSEHAESLWYLGAILADAARSEEAEATLLRAGSIVDRLGARAEPLAAGVALSLAQLYDAQTDSLRARPHAERALTILERIAGPEAPDTLQAMTLLGQIFIAVGDLGRAGELLERSLAALTRSLGEESPDIAPTLALLGGAKHELGDDAGAMADFERAIALRERALGPDDESAMMMRGNLAVVHMSIGDTEEAAALATQVFAWYEQRLGPDDARLAHWLVPMAEVARTRGDYARARDFAERAVRLAEQPQGEEATLAEALTARALLSAAVGDQAPAAVDCERAVALTERLRGSTSLSLAKAHEVCAIIHTEARAFDAGRESARKALLIREATEGPTHPDLAYPLVTLAALERDRGNASAARPLLERALAVLSASLPPGHPTLVAAQHQLGLTLIVEGDLGRARALLGDAYAARRAVVPGPDEIAGQLLFDLAQVAERQGDGARSSALWRDAWDTREGQLGVVLGSGSEAERVGLVQRYEQELAATVMHALRLGTPEASDVALTAILRSKGRVLDAVAAELQLSRAADSPQAKELVEQLRVARAALARGALGGPAGPAAPAVQGELAARVRSAESRLAELGLGAPGAGDAPADANSVLAALPPGAALVEWLVYQPVELAGAYEPADPSRRRYAAAVGDRRGVHWADLGPASAIDAAIAQARDALASPDADARAALRALDELVFHPLRPLLGDATTVVASPDGLLSLVPLAALVDEDDHYLVERWRIDYVTSGRDLLATGRNAAARSAPLIVAAADFGAAAERRGLFANVTLPPLPGSSTEAAALARVVPNATVLSGRQATKAALLAAKGPELLHIATHGFFLRADGKLGARLRDPLLRSGLALAGANEATSDADAEGILTALEATALDLRGTKLVVLSACDTGLGNPVDGEGVYGLRRALRLAGAEAQLTSLWKVDDDATRALMVSYYEKLAAGMGRGEALRDVELGLLRSPKTAHPHYWAPFVLVGDTTPLGPTSFAIEPPKVPPSARGCACRLADDRSSPAGAWLALALGAGAFAGRRRSSVGRGRD